MNLTLRILSCSDNYQPLQRDTIQQAMISTSVNIYVVDDDESARTGLGRLLRSAGYNVETFGSAQDYLDHSQINSTALLILDVRMPGIGGLELQKILAAKGSKLPIIFLTAFDDPQAQREALNSGAFAFLQKPVEEQTLFGAINEAFQRKANRNNR